MGRGPIKVAVIGVGHLGKEHARVYRELREAELVCIVDIDESRAREVAHTLGVPFCLDYREIPETVEAVSVVTPTVSHYEIGKYCLEQGMHVLLEKPMTETTEEARELVEIAKRKKRKLQVGHIERFNPGFRGILPYIQNPRFIQAHRLSPFSFRSLDVSVVHDLMIHDIDIVLELSKSEVVEVEALGLPVLTETEDMAQVRLKFANGCIADITANRVGWKKLRQIRLFQRGAYITLDYMTKCARIFTLRPDYTPEMLKKFSPPQTVEEINALIFHDFIQVRELSWEGEEPLKLELRSFLKAIREDKVPEVPGEVGLRALEVVEKIFDYIRRIWKKENLNVRTAFHPQSAPHSEKPPE